MQIKWIYLCLMQARRFDKQLRTVFMVLSGLIILVGLTSIGVNRYLVTSHEWVLSESIAIIRRAERIGPDADLATTLAQQLAQAETEAEIIRNSDALMRQIDQIDAGIVDLRRFLAEPGGNPEDAAKAHALVAQMSTAVRRRITLAATLQDEKARLQEALARLTELCSAQTDLARLHITAALWQIYAAPTDPQIRQLLDRLADVDFFGFERIRDLTDAIAKLSVAVQQVADTETSAALAPLRSDMETALALSLARVDYLPSKLAARTARQDLALFRDTLGANGLIGRRQDELATLVAISVLADQLDGRLAVLTAEARSGQEAARSLMRGRIADAGWRATLLSMALGFVIVCGVLAGYLVWARARTHIVSRLGTAAERIVQLARGETGAPMPISGHDEIGRLEKAVNVLRRRTDEALRLRHSLEAAVLARTSEIVAETRSANAARAEAEEESRAKTHFLARMSHEIRTPLNGVIGMLDLQVGDEPDTARRAQLQTALTSARDLQALTEDILTFASSEDHAPITQLMAFAPATLAKGLADHLQVLAQAKGLIVGIEIAENLPPALMGEPTRIRQVMINLISNAVKYTLVGEVRLMVSHRPVSGGVLHEIAFRVADTGPGMTAEETRHAFDIYGRTVDARRRGVQGVGLGLAIVRQLTDAMGGELRISSAPGRGSSFTLALRLPLSDPASLRIEDSNGVLPRGLRVLVVDDHPVNRLVARGYLERMGCAVFEAATGTEALAKAVADRFDAILIDLDLPDMCGETVAARIDRKGALLAVATADQVRDDVETRARLGVDHVLTKPLSARALAAALTDGPVLPQTFDDSPPEAILREDIANLGADMVSEIVTIFLTDLATSVPLILKADTADQRRRAAHRLKGAASNFALHELCALLQRIQSVDGAGLDGLMLSAEAAAASLRRAALSAGLQLAQGSAKT